MTKIFRLLLLTALMGVTGTSFALDESQAEDMADLTAVFIYLKNDCGYQKIPDNQIRNALIFFARQNHWDLSNYDQMNMQQLGEASYEDLSGIAVPQAQKCQSLADKSLSLLSYVKQ
ncbi:MULTISPECIES: YacC family pilotin-like protein [Tatumella]|uniref:Lipoprotein, PulS/OutS family n=2 Tax=Tatumella ptyseos TaxID=82987 RepID=A0A2X5PSV2_9GAMM|nr:MULTISPECIES: YacC family pilotin-like protein [Tatumella]KFD20676.1 putative YacC family chaperone lipoprotein [Tatumella ptyseos ATCC 33301]SQK76240.1 lipoprotein, PulS/OutS family [Tatumella ptyseos]